jgi:hypothetical protein
MGTHTTQWLRAVVCLWLLAASLHVRAQPGSGEAPIAGSPDCDSLFERKSTDNRGVGPMELMGVRNLRTVLNGVMYRSGANNNLNPFLSRSNNNPLSLQTLLNLWESGFDKVYYLYSDNFGSNYPQEVLSGLSDLGIEYKSVVPNNDSLRYLLLEELHGRIRKPGQGAMLFHCWNGWHMSGYVSALALRQFCDFNAEQAWRYWKSCTDGHSEGFEKIRVRIKDFTPYRNLTITEDEKKRICPCRTQ